MPSTRGALQTTLDLFGTGLDLMRQNLRREHPEANAESGDCPGRPVDVNTNVG